eukprot:GEMP01074793.1.p1 GENE.GEMP01074793.1~~GEMP01074793.1.p1  ORF type:complete len:172 (+),score=21.38 GEMP01074793.1:102-617(+)
MSFFRSDPNAEQTLGEVRRAPKPITRAQTANMEQRRVVTSPQTRIQIGSPRRKSAVHRDLLMTNFYEQNPTFRPQAPDRQAFKELVARQNRLSRQEEETPIDPKEANGWGLDVHYMEDLRNPTADRASSQMSPRSQASPHCKTHSHKTSSRADSHKAPSRVMSMSGKSFGA